MACARRPRVPGGPPPAPGRPGFTVMELLVTAGVAVLILGALYVLLERHVTLYGQGEAKADVQQGVRVVLDELATNLRAAGNGVPRGTTAGNPEALYILYNGITVGGEPLVTDATAVTFLGDIDGTAAELTGAAATGGTSVSLANATRDYSVSLTGGPNTVVVASSGAFGAAPFGTWAFGQYNGPPSAGLQSSIPVTSLCLPAGCGTAANFPPGGGVAALEVVKYALLQGIDFRGLPCQPSCLVRLIGLYGGQASASAPTICWSSRSCQPVPETLLDNVVGLTFTYFDANNAAVATVTAPGDPGTIRRLRIGLQVRAGKGLPDTVHTVDVRLRTL